MFASFHSQGTIPSSSDKLNNFASGVLICLTILTPFDLLSFIFLIVFAVITGVTEMIAKIKKCSDLLPSNFINGTGSELISYVVKTEQKYSFRTSAIRNPSEIMFPLLFSSGPT